MRPATTILYCIYTTKISQQFWQLRITLIAIFRRAAIEPAHNNWFGPLP
jgi:hypothetical protein